METTLYFDSDGYQLAGTLHLPERSNPPVIIGCHGLLANRRSQKQISLAHATNRKGLAYFRFDHRGCGESEGRFSKVTSLEARCRDIYHAVQAMQRHSEVGPLAGLFGSSFGGTVVLVYGAQNPTPALITYAAPINSHDIHRINIRDDKDRVPSSDLLTNALTFDIAPSLSSIRNILVMHSAGDKTVPMSHAHHIFTAARYPKHLFIFKNGDHRMSDASHQREFEAKVVDWLIKHN